LYPGDENLSFDYGGSALRLGGVTSKSFGRIAIRVVDYPGFEATTLSVTLRFHFACDDVAPDVSVYSGYLSAQSAPAPLVSSTDVPQSRTGRLSVTSVAALLGVEQVDSITLVSAGIIGRDLLTGGILYKIDSNGIKTQITSVGTTSGVSTSLWNSPSLNPVNVALQNGDFLQWTCNYASTLNPPFPYLVEPGSSIVSGDLFSDFACDIAGVFVNAKCGAAQFDPVNTLPTACLDPLFVPPAPVVTSDHVPLIFDYTQNGDCSDGGQWKSSAQNCWKQYGANKCAFCVGRANNIESRTCIERAGAECNPIFRSAQLKSFCNMEFECPASSVMFSLVAFLTALLALLF